MPNSKTRKRRRVRNVGLVATSPDEKKSDTTVDTDGVMCDENKNATTGDPDASSGLDVPQQLNNSQDLVETVNALFVLPPRSDGVPSVACNDPQTFVPVPPTLLSATSLTDYPILSPGPAMLSAASAPARFSASIPSPTPSPPPILPHIEYLRRVPPPSLCTQAPTYYTYRHPRPSPVPFMYIPEQYIWNMSGSCQP